MKSTGIVRKIDELGRIVIPMELRRSLTIVKGDAIEISAYKELIILEKSADKTDSSSIVRNLDELGRIVVPVELRRKLDISEGDAVEIFVDGSKIMLKKYVPGCIFCGNIQEIINYKGKKICKSCKDDIIKLED